MSVRSVLVPLLAASLLAPACKGDGAAQVGGAAEPAPPPPASRAVDQAPLDEVSEGAEVAFGLPLPRRMAVHARFSDAVFAVGRIEQERVANYVRARVVAETVETGPAKTVFSNATLKKSPARVVRIEVTARGDDTELVVRDETKPPAEEGLSEEERWRKQGLRPDGTPLDPTRLQ